MPIYKPSELRLFLDELGIAPKKGLSQNFLIDGNIIRKIVAAADVQPDDCILEIGPGPGSLTQALLETGAHIVAVEKDQVLAGALERLQTPTNQLEVFCDDILDFPLETKFAGQTNIKVIANLPYHLTTPILVYLLSKRHLFSTFTLMVQDEVGRRFTASPGGKEYGSFTVFLDFYTIPRYAFTVSHNCFYPAPKVDSAVVVLASKTPPVVDSEEQFFQLTRTAFKQRRKMLRASLKSLFEPHLVSAALEQLGLNVQARPEELSLEDFLRLYAALPQPESN
jgi:16S rRNA (adenine1518-N6/adenine1519-N6)-dimethyltransferase